MKVQFDGALGYRQLSHYDKKGRAHYVTNWYHKSDITLQPIHCTENQREMFYYAAYDFRRKYVYEALSLTSLREAAPLSRYSYPRGCDFPPFEAKPSLAFGAVYTKRLPNIAKKYANHYMESRPSDTFVNRGLLFDDYACPARDYIQNDYYRIENVRIDVNHEKFNRHGVVLLPVWVVSYTHNRKPFKAFVNGENGTVSCLVHLDSSVMSQFYALMGAGIGWGFVKLLVSGTLQSTQKPTYMPWDQALNLAHQYPAETALFAGFLGCTCGVSWGKWLTGRREFQWESHGELRNTERTRNRSWARDPYWQGQLNQFFRDKESSWQEESAEKNERWKEQRQQENQAHADATGNWRDMDEYQILGLVRDPHPTSREISRAFRSQAHRWHPDHNMQQSEEIQADCQERFKQIMSAYSILRKNAKARRL